MRPRVRHLAQETLGVMRQRRDSRPRGTAPVDGSSECMPLSGNELRSRTGLLPAALQVVYVLLAMLRTATPLPSQVCKGNI